MVSRRQLLTGAMLAAPALMSLRAEAAGDDRERLRGIASLERRYGGRLGVAILDTSTITPITYRGDERFPLCSTFKVLAAAFVLARLDAGKESLARRIRYSRDCLVPHSPITEKHAGGDGLTIGEICATAMTLSDNTAANLLLDSFGGPAALTAYLRSLGDHLTRLDRRETALNEAQPGDPRDTTSPFAMVKLLRTTVCGTALSVSARAQLAAWLVANRTGDQRLRAGIPHGWRVGDKTGSGGYHATNDVAVVWPPRGATMIVAAYYVESTAPEDARNAVLAEIGRLAVRA
jgi:beta-lactamase class A